MSAPSPITTLVLGAGFMGHYVSIDLALAGHLVILCDESEQKLNDQQHLQDFWLKKFHENQIIDPKDFDEIKQRIQFNTAPHIPTQDIQLFIECIPENLALKQKIFKEWEKQLPLDCVITSNSSTILPSKLKSSLQDPSRFAALHFNQNTDFIDLVPVKETSPSVEQFLKDFISSLNKTHLSPKFEKSGFIFNSLQESINSALFMQWHFEKKDLFEIDRAFVTAQKERKSKRLMSILTRLDSIGLETVRNCTQTMIESMPSPDACRLEYQRAILGLFDSYLNRGANGHLSGEGFYTYPQDMEHHSTTEDIHLIKPILSAWYVESLSLYSKGHYDFRDIDRCWMMAHQTPKGPFGEMDEIGLKKIYRQLLGHHKNLLKRFGEMDRFTLQVQSALNFLKHWIQNDREGQKNQRGFYDYPNPPYELDSFCHQSFQPLSNSSKTNWELEIDNLCICNFFSEDQNNDKEGTSFGKFIISFQPPGITTPEHIKSIHISGPNGYHLTVNPQQRYTSPIPQGYVYHRGSDYLYYQIFDSNGFIEDGNYTIEVTYHSGRTVSKTKTFNCNYKLFEAWKNHNSHYSPKGHYSNNDQELTLKWNQLENNNAYYCARLIEFVEKDDTPFTNNCLAIDPIFKPIKATQDGYKRTDFTCTPNLRPNRKYGWNVEILDSNALEDITIAIFQKINHFET